MNDDDDIEILMDRALAGDLAADGWEKLAACALLRPEIHRRFFEEARDRAGLVEVMAPLHERASLVSLPAAPARQFTARRVVAAALVLALAALGFAAGNLNGRRGLRQASDIAAKSPTREIELDSEAYLQRYLALGLKEGRVLFELPPTVIEAERVDEGSGLVDLVFVRRIVERAQSDRVVTLEHDEHGNAHGRLVATRSLASEKSY